MKQNDFIEWRNFEENLNNTTCFSDFEAIYKFILPKSYKNLVRFRDGGILKKDLFYYKFQNDNWRNCVGRFLYWDARMSKISNILHEIQEPPEFFPKGLIAFAPDGGGNYICFDYRHCRKNPPIVYWDHGIEENEGIFFLANSFDEFLSMLKSEEEIDALTQQESAS